MKITPPKPAFSTSPATSGNPAYPSLKARDKIIAENKNRPEIVKKISADQIKKHEASAGKMN
jgi:hypothetical protein